MMRSANESKLLWCIIIGYAMGGADIPFWRNDGRAAVVVPVRRQLT